MARKRPSILVVDDEPGVRELLKRSLEAEGFGVACCADAPAALERLASETFEAVLLDNGLPGMMGLAALPSILQLTKAPVILITGFDSEDTVKDALLLGAKAVLHKPFDMDELLAELRRLIAARGN